MSVKLVSKGEVFLEIQLEAWDYVETFIIIKRDALELIEILFAYFDEYGEEGDILELEEMGYLKKK